MRNGNEDPPVNPALAEGLPAIGIPIAGDRREEKIFRTLVAAGSPRSHFRTTEKNIERIQPLLFFLVNRDRHSYTDQ
jgi:hypothetical protein